MRNKKRGAKTMKNTGWLLIFIGSNVLTASLVTLRNYRKLDEKVNETIDAAGDWVSDNLGEFVGDVVDDAVGEIPFIGSIGSKVGDVIDDKLSEKTGEFVKGFHGISENVDVKGRTTAQTFSYVGAVILVLGIAALITDYVKKAKRKND
jgi:hypothetical protein